MIRFCTLFDRNYLYKGLVMYNSLAGLCSAFHLYILCFDDVTHRILKEMSLQHVTLISMLEFENEKLLRVKKDRTTAEYCWTCTSSLILYVFNKYTEVQELTYLDADLMFFSSPEEVLEGLGENSVLITPHRYTSEYDQSAKSGIYCVQFLTFKKDKNGLAALKWWHEKCIDWCYNRAEDGKFGDQKYLDDWPERFRGVYVLNDIGAGAAPWNIQQYAITADGGALKVNDRDIFFYHFHFFTCYTNGEYDLGMYDISEAAIELIYRPYIEALVKAEEQVGIVDGKFSSGKVEKYRDWTYPFRYINRKIRGYYHVIK